jgi:hypothetical protein
MSRDGEKTSKEPLTRVRTAAPRTFGPAGPSSRILRSDARTSAAPPSAGEQNMNLVSGIGDHLGAHDGVQADRLAPPGVRGARAVFERLFRHAAQAYGVMPLSAM